jgi:hypothetical protein
VGDSLAIQRQSVINATNAARSFVVIPITP